MPKLRIKNCGPIDEGFTTEDGFINLSRFLLFVGDQGTGKSTVAKFVSIFSWLEKAFVRGDYKADFFNSKDFRELYENQLLGEFVTGKTELEYIGDAYHFLYKDSIFLVKANSESINKYLRPKIMYIPSERNILSVIKNVDDLDNLPPMLRLLRTRYLQASGKLNNNGFYKLPLENYNTIIDESTGETRVQEGKTGMSVPLMCASSGLQSIVPSSIVTEYLASLSKLPLMEKIRNLRGKELTELKNSIQDESVRQELERYITSGISKSISQDSIPVFEKKANSFINAYFLNIVEEPEQNLFPDSQMKNIDFLINSAKQNERNKLVLTTHSPYVLSYVTLSAKAFELYKNNVPTDLIEEIIPKTSWFDGNECRVYQMENGKINLLQTYDRGLPSDNNLLNDSLGKTNDMFDELLDLEEKFSD